MRSVASIYNRLERASARSDYDALHAWMGRRTDYSVQEAIKHGVRMATDDDYRLGVEAGRFAKHYADTIEGFTGTGRTGQQYKGLIEGALRLRAGADTESGRTATRREVERLLAVRRAEIEPVAESQREIILWGIPQGETDPLYEKVLYTKGKTMADVERVKAIAARDGWHTFRVQTIDLSQPFDAQRAFAGGLR